jgi:O-antigen/teichoic acid export membrane protein
MPRIRQIASNILSNWFALGVTSMVGFFLAPFVVHHLGNITYGVWVLITSLVSYMGLLDLGMRGAVTRFVSKGAAQQNDQEANEAVSGALWIRLWLSAAIVFVAVLLAGGFKHAFTVPLDLQTPARIAILITALTVAINLCGGVFGGVLVALHRYDLTSAVSITQTGARACGFVWLLLSGHGIVALAIWDLGTWVAANAITIILAFRTYPRLKVALSRPDSQTLKKLWRYSFYVFVINLAVQVTYYSDNLVVGAFLTPTAVTLYAVGGILITYARQIVAAMTTTFTPLASTLEAQGSHNHLCDLLIHGTRASLIISLPIEVALFFRGHTFIRLWMGEQYAGPSGTVMQILVLSMMFSSAMTTAGGIVFGMEKHKRVAYWAVGEAIANLALSIVLVRRIGIYGVAWGTAIPSVIVEVLLWPRYICKLLQIPIRTYLWQAWGRTSLALVPFSLSCVLAEQLWPAHNLVSFFLQIVALLPLVPLALALVFRNEVITLGQKWINRWKAAHRLNHEYQSSTTAIS